MSHTYSVCLVEGLCLPNKALCLDGGKKGGGDVEKFFFFYTLNGEENVRKN